MAHSKTEDWTNVSFEDGKSTLRKWREDNVRKSEETVEIWQHVLSRHPNSLGDELWIVYEQVCIAAFDCSRLDVSQDCIGALFEKFPDSRRVMKLNAMMLETTNKFSEAAEYYDKLIKDDESNPVYRKRKVAIFKAQGKIQEAIRELNEYLKKFMNDSEAWLELSTLYLTDLDYAKAAYCAEELILAHPRDHLYHQLYAEIKYSQGGRDNLELAKSYYAEATKLNPENVRALWGLFMSANQLLSKETGQKKKDLANVVLWANDQLLKMYKNRSSNGNSVNYEKHIESIESFLKQSKTSDFS